MIVRRLCAVLFLVVVCIGTACSSKEPKVVTAFSSNVKIEYETMVFEGDLRCCPQAETMLFLTDPPDAKGIVFRCDGNRLNTEWNGEALCLDEAPTSALPILIHSVFSDIEANGKKTQGIVNGRRYFCEFDNVNGLPVSLFFENEKLKVHFLSVKPLAEDTTDKTTYS